MRHPLREGRDGRGGRAWWAGLVMLAAACGAAAQTFPNRPVRFIVTSAAGGLTTDGTTRLVALHLGNLWKQPVIVENRVGGNSIIGTQAMVKSEPDGHTLLTNTTATAQNVGTRPQQLPYDTLRDIAAVTQLFSISIAYSVDARVPVNSLGEFIALVRANPGKYNFRSYGNGSTAHMMAAKLSHDAKINIVHIPYKGATDAIRALVAGEVSAIMSNITEISSQQAVGKARMLAVTGRKRSEFAPDLPTFEESGIGGFTVESWAGVFAPGATPEPILRKIADDINQVKMLPEVKAHYRRASIEITPLTNAEFREVFRRDVEYWTRLVKDTGIKVD